MIPKSAYEVLGVNKESTADEVREAYLNLAARHHPDRGGDVEGFREIHAAYARVMNKLSSDLQPDPVTAVSHDWIPTPPPARAIVPERTEAQNRAMIGCLCLLGVCVVLSCGGIVWGILERASER